MDVKQDHIKRINNTILYIENNLSEKLTIDDLAEMACFSKFHFSRIFKEETGESVYHFIKRLRLERASHYLWASDKSIKDIAFKCGFSTTSNFSYNYKQHFGISAREQKEKNRYYKELESCPDISVEIKEIEKMRLGYIKRIGSYNYNYMDQVNRILNWAKARGENPDKLVLLGYDSTYITKAEFLRADICVPVSDKIKANDDISIMNFPRIRVISTKVKNFKCTPEIRDKLDAWINFSGYQSIVGVPTLYIHKNIKNINGSGVDHDRLQTEICVPVKPK